MSAPGHQRGIVFLSAFCFALLALCGYLFAKNGELKVRQALAEEQMLIFAEMERRASRANLSDAAQFLSSVVSYYPSGTKQETDSRLDRMVEQARASTVREIIDHLRTKSGEDLGGDPESWIAKYATEN